MGHRRHAGVRVTTTLPPTTSYTELRHLVHLELSGLYSYWWCHAWRNGKLLATLPAWTPLLHLTSQVLPGMETEVLPLRPTPVIRSCQWPSRPSGILILMQSMAFLRDLGHHVKQVTGEDELFTFSVVHRGNVIWGQC